MLWKMLRFGLRAVCLAGLLGAPALPPTSRAEDAAHPKKALLRFPAIDRGRIVFTCADDLWITDPGGTARRLTRMPGRESFPHFSPNGRRIGFTGETGSGESLFTVSVEGGEP